MPPRGACDFRGLEIENGGLAAIPPAAATAGPLLRGADDRSALDRRAGYPPGSDRPGGLGTTGAATVGLSALHASGALGASGRLRGAFSLRPSGRA